MANSTDYEFMAQYEIDRESEIWSSPFTFPPPPDKVRIH